MKILFISLGCDKNLVDSEVMIGMLNQQGYQMTDITSASLLLFDFMEYKLYFEYLCTIDIAIFAHNRSQDMGNIINLLGLGKKYT